MTNADRQTAPRAATSSPANGRDQTRQRVIGAASELLATEGRDGVTTRGVAARAGVRAPAIYALFGDKDGLLAAVAEHGYAAFVTGKIATEHHEDPIEDLRAGWDLAVDFGITNPELYTLIHNEASPGRMIDVLRTASEILLARIRRVAAAGRLRVDENLAAAILQASARGTVLTWLSLTEQQRPEGLVLAMREAMITAVTTETSVLRQPGRGGAARSLRATLPGQSALSANEERLLGDWLDRIEDHDSVVE